MLSAGEPVFKGIGETNPRAEVKVRVAQRKDGIKAVKGVAADLVNAAPMDAADGSLW